MKIGIGIDTGGTCTDSVIYDFDAGQVLAKGKALTTKEDLTIGIGNALDSLPDDLRKRARVISLSTTLATNACVEDKGGRAKLLLIGTTRETLKWIGAEEKYGLKDEEVCCIASKGSLDGTVAEEPDWDTILEEECQWLRDADALSVSEVYSNFNGAVIEKNAKSFLHQHTDVPIVLASDLVNDLNVMERGATALLNARLLPVIQEFMQAVKTSLAARNLDIPTVIVRSDGSLMSDKLSKDRPVETILSGPAASILGGKALTTSENCLIVDMGGTTTDISIVKNGQPVMVDKGIQIGGWRTQIKGVYIDTFSLGGDTAIQLKEGRLVLSARRALPYCIAAEKWPQIKEDLKQVLQEGKIFYYTNYEFLYLVRMPGDLSRYNPYERALCQALQNAPCMVGNLATRLDIDVYNLNLERLESEGVIMRCGLTPTDIMHIRGDFEMYDTEASTMAASIFLRLHSDYKADPESMEAFTEEVYDLVKSMLYQNLVRVLLTDKHPELFGKEFSPQLNQLIAKSWEQETDNFFHYMFSTNATLVGIGAPTHLFLPDVAKALKTDCVIPEHAGVANAVGAVVADVSAEARVEIKPNYTNDGIQSYTIFTPNGNKTFNDLDQACQAAKEAAIQAATEEARKRGSLGELKVDATVTHDIAKAKRGESVYLGTTAIAAVTGQIDIMQA